MMSRKGPSSTGKNRTGTVNGNRGNQSLSQEAVRLLKTQDLGYVRTMRNKAIKEVELLEKSVVGIRSAGRRIIYIDDQAKQGQNPITVDEKDGEVVAVPGNLETGKLRKPQHEEQSKLEARLERAHKRLKTLAEAEEALDIQRAKMAKSLTVGGVNKQGVKFRARERKP
jgi:U3 small nucleolar RNA-associated protein 11